MNNNINDSNNSAVGTEPLGWNNMKASVGDVRYLSEGTTLIGRYYIQSVIGSGGFGITYVAWDTLTETHVAIKEYFPAGVVNRVGNTVTLSVSAEEYRTEFIKGKQRFLAEAKDLLKFKAASDIVNVLNFFEENSTAYTVMEYINGFTLESYIKSNGNRFSVDVALDVFTKAMKALETVHNAGIIHRDISPDNIMILHDYSVKLIDFGTAKQAYCGETQNLSIVLKPGYAPAEQYSNTAPQGPWTDIYALGATLYRMLTGKKPLESVSRMLVDGIVPPIELNKDIPVYLNNIILKALAIKPEDRFRSIAELSQALLDKKVDAGIEKTMAAIPDKDKAAAEEWVPHFEEMKPVNMTEATPEIIASEKIVYSDNYSGNSNPSNKKKTGYIILIVCLIALVGLGILGISRFYSGKNKGGNTT